MRNNHRLVALAVCLGLAASPVAAQSDLAISQQEFAARRAALARSIGDGVVLVYGAVEPTPDYLPWVQSASFFYLTGLREPGAALLSVVTGGKAQELLFVRQRNPAQEVWNGKRVGVDGTRAAFGIEGRDVRALDQVLDSLLRDEQSLHVVGDFGGAEHSLTVHTQRLLALRERYAPRSVTDASEAVQALRGVKSGAEFDRLRIAAEISARGHLAAFRLAQPGVGEFELQAAAEHAWRAEGADGPGYLSILGSGPNSTTLHYNENSRVTKAGDLVVMDMAASFDGYSADITRTIPVSGRFTDAQRDIYQVVLAAQLAAERQVRVGNAARSMTDSSTAVLRDGLARLGLIESPGATYDCGTAERARQCPQIGLFYMHGLGHGIGLEVHDPDQYYVTGVIGVGSAFTLEPGIYVRENLAEAMPDTPRNRAYLAKIATAFTRYAGIGVRIEDDYLVTANGVLRPSSGVPRDIDAVERVMTEPRTPRDPTVVERFRRYRSGR